MFPNKNSSTNDGETFMGVNFQVQNEAHARINTKPGFCIKSKKRTRHENFHQCLSLRYSGETRWKGTPTQEYRSKKRPVHFPLGLGLPHQEKDNSETIVFVSMSFSTANLSTLFLWTLPLSAIPVTLCINGIRDKYGVLIDRENCVKLRKLYHGEAIRRFIRTSDPNSFPSSRQAYTPQSSSAPLIQELESSSFEEGAVSTYIEPSAIADLQKPTKSQSPKKSSSTADDLLYLISLNQPSLKISRPIHHSQVQLH
ncbi:hypothetical protein CEXT_581231 [Caerostris extrusa]|uniref:Uncharacterized protein n=1 Tax=Caerostris extrusa TaxID=172846 RepID=A0AAV4XI57_CAEEX|nr:hypothetical protein CEXT_581231 [Caerostris extrusa]